MSQATEDTKGELRATNVRLSSRHNELLDRLMTVTKPETSLRYFFEYLIEQEAERRGILHKDSPVVAAVNKGESA